MSNKNKKKIYTVEYMRLGADSPTLYFFSNKKLAEKFAEKDYTSSVYAKFISKEFYERLEDLVMIDPDIDNNFL